MRSLLALTLCLSLTSPEAAWSAFRSSSKTTPCPSAITAQALTAISFSSRNISNGFNRVVERSLSLLRGPDAFGLVPVGGVAIPAENRSWRDVIDGLGQIFTKGKSAKQSPSAKHTSQPATKTKQKSSWFGWKGGLIAMIAVVAIVVGIFRSQNSPEQTPTPRPVPGPTKDQTPLTTEIARDRLLAFLDQQNNFHDAIEQIELPPGYPRDALRQAPQTLRRWLTDHPIVFGDSLQKQDRWFTIDFTGKQTIIDPTNFELLLSYFPEFIFHELTHMSAVQLDETESLNRHRLRLQEESLKQPVNSPLYLKQFRTIYRIALRRDWYVETESYYLMMAYQQLRATQKRLPLGASCLLPLREVANRNQIRIELLREASTGQRLSAIDQLIVRTAFNNYARSALYTPNGPTPQFCDFVFANSVCIHPVIQEALKGLAMVEKGAPFDPEEAAQAVQTPESALRVAAWARPLVLEQPLPIPVPARRGKTMTPSIIGAIFSLPFLGLLQAFASTPGSAGAVVDNHAGLFVSIWTLVGFALIGTGAWLWKNRAATDSTKWPFMRTLFLVEIALLESPLTLSAKYGWLAAIGFLWAVFIVIPRKPTRLIAEAPNSPDQLKLWRDEGFLRTLAFAVSMMVGHYHSLGVRNEFASAVRNHQISSVLLLKLGHFINGWIFDALFMTIPVLIWTAVHAVYALTPDRNRSWSRIFWITIVSVLVGFEFWTYFTGPFAIQYDFKGQNAFTQLFDVHLDSPTGTYFSWGDVIAFLIAGRIGYSLMVFLPRLAYTLAIEKEQRSAVLEKAA